MRKPKDPFYVLLRVQAEIQSVDPKLVRSLVAEPSRPDEPFVFEYIDRLIAALQERVDRDDVRRDPSLPIYVVMIRNLGRLRAALEKGV